MTPKLAYIYSTLLISGIIILLTEVMILGIIGFSKTIPPEMDASDKIAFILILSLPVRYWYVPVLMFLAHLTTVVLMFTLDSQRPWNRLMTWYGIFIAAIVIGAITSEIVTSPYFNLFVPSVHLSLVVLPCIWIVHGIRKHAQPAA